MVHDDSNAVGHRIAAPFYGAILILGGCATIFIPPLYKEDLIDWLNLSESETSIFFTTLNCFNFFMLIAAAFVEKYGLRLSGITAAALTLAGYLLLYIVVNHRGNISVLWAYLAAALCGQGSNFSIMTSLKVIAASVETADRGKAIGLCMSFFGLSGGYYTAMYHVILHDQTQEWLFLVFGGSMAAHMAISSTLIWFVDTGSSSPKANQQSGNMNYILAYCIVATALVCALPFSTGVAQKVVSGVLVGSLIILLLLALGLFMNIAMIDTPIESTLLPDKNLRSAVSEEPGVEVHTAVREPRYWLLWYQLSILTGAGVATINLLDDIIMAATSSKESQESLMTGGTAAFSVGNIVSRFMLGYLSDILLAFFDRTSFMTMAIGVMAAAMVLIGAIDASSRFIYLPCLLSGFAFGMPWILVPAIEIDWYGHKHFPPIHGIMMLGAVVGTLLFFDAISTITEDRTEHNPYQLTWKVLAVFCVCGFFGDMLLRMRESCSNAAYTEFTDSGGSSSEG